MTDLITAEGAKMLLTYGVLGEENIYGHADNLARTVIALHAELAQARADAKAAVAVVVEKAAEMAREGFMIVAPEGIGQRMALDSYRAQISTNIRALAPDRKSVV